MPPARVPAHTQAPDASASGRRQVRPARVPTVPPTRNGQATSSTPTGVTPSAWLTRPTVAKSRTAAPSATLASQTRTAARLR